MRLRTLLLTTVVAAAGAAFLAPASYAERGDSRDERTSDVDGDFSFHIGVFEPRGDSELWKVNEATFTTDHTDLADAVVGGAFASHLNRWFDFQVGGEYYDTGDVRSEYRDFTFVNGDPIRHRTRFRQVPIELSVKLLPFGRSEARGRRGRTVLRPVVPYLGGGGGGLLWDYRERGRFVDLTDPNDPTLFRGDFHARGLAGSLHALAGVEIQFGERAALVIEGRYRWAQDRLGSDFPGFDRFDLSGGSLRAGMSFRL